jgi:hypothetical protein
MAMTSCTVTRGSGFIVIHFTDQVGLVLLLQGDDVIRFRESCGVEDAADATLCPQDYREQALRERYNCQVLLDAMCRRSGYRTV